VPNSASTQTADLARRCRRWFLTDRTANDQMPPRHAAPG